jgi:hypothetical protein
MKKMLISFYYVLLTYALSAHMQEGFLENTLVWTPDGYHTIQELTVGDVVYDQDMQEKVITHTFHYITDHYLQIYLDGQIINCGLEQKIYLKDHNLWMKACDLTLQECDGVTPVHDQVIMYCFTVQDHIFQVSHHNIITHNSAAALIAPSIVLEFIQLAQPVLVLLGATIPLCYFSSYTPFVEHGNTLVYQPSQEKIYFDNRYQQLNKLKQELLSINGLLKSVSGQVQGSLYILNCHSVVQNNVANTTKITPAYEGELDFEARLELSEIRKKILQDLEQEICDLQISMGLFVNEIVCRKNETVGAYNDFVDHYMQKNFVASGNTRLAAIQYYERLHISLAYIDEVEQRMRECVVLTQLFQRYVRDPLITQTTNIVSVLAFEQQEIHDSSIVLERSKQQVLQILKKVHEYFQKNPPFPNISHAIAAMQNQLKQSIQNKSKMQLHKQMYAKLPDPSDDDDDAPRHYEKSPKHPNYSTREQAEKYLARGISPSPQDGQAALDISIKIKDHIRASTQDGFIVMLHRARRLPEGGSIYHGFIINFENLKFRARQSTINLLEKAGFVSSKGEIL